MAKTRKPKQKSNASVPVQARLLFTQLQTQYADATAQEWDELADHLHGQLAVIAGGNERRREQLMAEFERVRAVTLGGRQTRQLRMALRAGAAQLLRDRGDGLEEWQVDVDGQTLTLYVPAESPERGMQVARKALLGGWCPSCRVGADIVAGTVEFTHNRLCPARGVLAD